MTTTETQSFRNLIINVLSTKDGVSPEIFTSMVEHAKNFHPNSCDDVFSLCNTMSTGHYHLRYDHADQLKNCDVIEQFFNDMSDHTKSVL